MALGGSKFTSFESDTCHPSYSSVSYVDLPKRTPREPKIRNERNSHPIGRKNCLGNHFWPGVFCFSLELLSNLSFSQMSSPLVPLAKYWRMLINRSWSCWEFPSSMHCNMRRCQIRVRFESGVKKKFLAALNQLLTSFFQCHDIPWSHSFPKRYDM